MKRFALYVLPALLIVPAIILGRKWGQPVPRRSEVPSRRRSTVYVTNFGTKYHRENCRMLSHSSTVHEIPLDDAIEQYEPCSECRPQRLPERI